MTQFVTESATVSERDAARTVASMLEGESPDYPLDLEGVADVCRRLEYAASADELRRLAGIGQIPDLVGYDAADLIAVLGCLEGRRSWKMTPSRHDGKKHPGRIALEQNVIAGPEAVATMLDGLRQFDFPFLLALLEESDSREMRARLCTVFAAKLIAPAFGIHDDSNPYAVSRQENDDV